MTQVKARAKGRLHAAVASLNRALEDISLLVEPVEGSVLPIGSFDHDNLVRLMSFFLIEGGDYKKADRTFHKALAEAAILVDGGHKGKAATRLGVTRKTLWMWLKEE